jgi:hypothetical protein
LQHAKLIMTSYVFRAYDYSSLRLHTRLGNIAP